MTDIQKKEKSIALVVLHWCVQAPAFDMWKDTQKKILSFCLKECRVCHVTKKYNRLSICMQWSAYVHLNLNLIFAALKNPLSLVVYITQADTN